MKKQLIILITLLTISLSGMSQDVYEQGDNLLSAGIGLGYYDYGYFGARNSSFPALTANYEIGFHEYISAGPYVGYKSWNYNYSGGDYGFSLLALGARGSFHYSTLINEALDMDINDEKLDLYVALILGVEIQKYTGDYGPYFTDQSDSVVRFGPSLGARYYLSDNFAVYAEGGRGILSWLTLGATLKM